MHQVRDYMPLTGCGRHKASVLSGFEELCLYLNLLISKVKKIAPGDKNVFLFSLFLWQIANVFFKLIPKLAIVTLSVHYEPLNSN